MFAVAICPLLFPDKTLPAKRNATYGLVWALTPPVVHVPETSRLPAPLSVAMGVVLPAYHLNCPLDVTTEFHIAPKSMPIAKSSSVATVDGYRTSLVPLDLQVPIVDGGAYPVAPTVVGGTV